MRYRLLFEQENLHKCGMECLLKWKTCTNAVSSIFELNKLAKRGKQVKQ